MFSFTTDDVSTWGYAYDTTGGAASPMAGIASINANPMKEYAAGGTGSELEGVPLVLPQSVDDYTRTYGFAGYDLMLTQPACLSSVVTLKLGIMSGAEVKLIETFPMKPGEENPSEDQNRSIEVKDFCQRLINRVPGLWQSILQLYDCAPYGNKLGEMTSRIEVRGEDTGKLVLDRFNVKKRDAWQFIVDNALNVTGIMIRRRNQSYARIRPDKFVWLSWMPRDNDPRGMSILRAAYGAWNMFTQLYPQYFKAMKQFAVPSLVGITAPDAKNEVVDGKVMTPQEFMVSQLIRFQNGSAMAVANGADVKAVAVPGNGNSFLDAFNFLNQEIVYGMLLQTRATREAQHGSKADSQTGSDILTLLIEYGRAIGGEAIRNAMLKFYVRENFGIDVAERYTPYVSFGTGEPADFVARCNALANLWKAGVITPSIIPEVFAMFGLPVPDPKVDAEQTTTQPAVVLPGEKPADDEAEPEEPEEPSEGDSRGFPQAA